MALYVISALDSASGDLGLSPRGSWNHFVVFLGKTLSASLHPGVQMGSGKHNSGITL